MVWWFSNMWVPNVLLVLKKIGYVSKKRTFLPQNMRFVANIVLAVSIAALLVGCLVVVVRTLLSK